MPGLIPSWSWAIRMVGAVVLFGEATSDDADDAGMPVAIGEDQGGVLFGVELFLDLLVGGSVDAAFEFLAAVVEPVDIVGQFFCAVGSVGGKEFDGELGLAESTGGIESWSENEADVF